MIVTKLLMATVTLGSYHARQIPRSSMSVIELQIRTLNAWWK